MEESVENRKKERVKKSLMEFCKRTRGRGCQIRLCPYFTGFLPDCVYN